jgi:hypothetical protein
MTVTHKRILTAWPLGLNYIAATIEIIEKTDGKYYYYLPHGRGNSLVITVCLMRGAGRWSPDCRCEKEKNVESSQVICG